MKKILIILSALATMGALYAQEPVDTLAYEIVDSLVYTPVSTVDESLVGKSVFEVLPSVAKGDASEVRVSQSDSIALHFEEHIEANKSKTLTGYRVRIFFDNSQTARVKSEETVTQFERQHPGIHAYRTYSAPFFKVTVGDFRTRSEAVYLLQDLVWSYPSAFVVKENINYPPVDKNNLYVVDTLKIRKYLE